MTPTNERGYDGYRAQLEFSNGPFNIISSNSNRPSNYVLSTVYTHEHVPGYDMAMRAAQRENKFPGQHF